MHPNTVRAWSEAGRLRFYRINDRGDRRYRLGDLQRFLAAAEAPAVDGAAGAPGAASGATRDPRRRSPRPRPASTSWPTSPRSPRSPPASIRRSTRRAAGSGSRRAPPWSASGSGARAGSSRGRARPRAQASTPSIDRCRRAAACSRRRSTRRRPIHARPGDTATPAACSGMGTDELVVRDPRRRGAVGRARARGRDAARARRRPPPRDGDRPHAGRARPGRRAADQAAGRLRRSEALRRVATDLASRLDIADVVRDLSDHARVLFGADRVAVILRDAEGRVSSPGGSGFSEAFLAAARDLEGPRMAQRRDPARAGRSSSLGPDAPALRRARSAPRRSRRASTACSSRRWSTATTCTASSTWPTTGPTAGARSTSTAAEALAGDAAIAVRSARTFGRMAAWAAQLQSIQRLGARLAGISDVREIGTTIATELRQLITYDNARVYRVTGEQLWPVAFQGHGIVTATRRPSRSSVEVGEGITGWVARFRVPQLVDDSANDPRGDHDPGHRRRHRRVDAARADGPRGRLPRRRGPGQGGAAPVHRGRPAAARDLRVVRRPGDGQRGRDRADARAVGGVRAPGARPGRAAPDHRVDPDHARRPRGPRADHRAARAR